MNRPIAFLAALLFAAIAVSSACIARSTPEAISFELKLNGERMQASSTADLIFSIPELVTRLSRLLTLEPGDVLATGTPFGVGSTRQPRVWLKAGDEVEISSPQLGRLLTRLA